MDADTVKALIAVGGAAVGAAVGAAIKGYSDARARDRRELRVLVSEPTRLIVLSASIAPRVELRVEGRLVQTIASCEVRIANVGNRSIADVCVAVVMEGGPEIITAEAVGTSQAIDGLEIRPQPRRAEIHIPYVNPAEQVEIRFLATGADFRTTVLFRQPDVKLRVRTGVEPDLLNPMLQALYSAVLGNPLLNVLVQVVDAGYRRYSSSERQRRRLEQQRSRFLPLPPPDEGNDKNQ